MKSLEDKIISELETAPMNCMSLRDLADVIYKGCMRERRKGNGGRITALKNASVKSKHLTYFLLSSCNDAPYVALERSTNEKA